MGRGKLGQRRLGAAGPVRRCLAPSLFISLSGTKVKKADGRTARLVGVGGSRGRGPCSHHIHKELTGVSHGHAEGLSAGGQFRGHGSQVTARRGSRGPHGRGRRWHHQHWGAVEWGHAGRAVAGVRVVAAQAAGQRVLAAVAVLTGGRARALAGGALPRPPKAAASSVVRLAAAATRL